MEVRRSPRGEVPRRRTGISMWLVAAAAACQAPSTASAEAGPAADQGWPTGVARLAVEGHAPAAFVAPDLAQAGDAPFPVTVVLHGNFDRPEWECDLWAAAGRERGWVLCPRGVPRRDVEPDLDRWTYRGRAALAVEIDAGVSALERRFPGKVRRDEALLVGFSLGANMAPLLLGMKVLPIRGVVLAEGGLGVTAEQAGRAARRGVARVLHLCGEQTICPARARTLLPLWRRARVAAAVMVMPGVGHAYPTDFDALSRRALSAITP